MTRSALLCWLLSFWYIRISQASLRGVLGCISHVGRQNLKKDNCLSSHFPFESNKIIIGCDQPLVISRNGNPLSFKGWIYESMKVWCFDYISFHMP